MQEPPVVAAEAVHRGEQQPRLVADRAAQRQASIERELGQREHVVRLEIRNDAEQADQREHGR